MSDPTHHSSVHGNLNAQDPIDVHEILTKKIKEISKLRDKIEKHLQTRESKTHRFRSRHGEGSHKDRSVHHSSPS